MRTDCGESESGRQALAGTDGKRYESPEIRKLHLDGEEQLAREEAAVQQEIRELEKTAESRMQGAVELILENLA